MCPNLIKVILCLFTLSPLPWTGECDTEAEVAVRYPEAETEAPLLWAGVNEELGYGGKERAQPDGAFALPHSHMSFREFVGDKGDLGKAVVPAAILAGYTGNTLSLL